MSLRVRIGALALLTACWVIVRMVAWPTPDEPDEPTPLVTKAEPRPEVKEEPEEKAAEQPRKVEVSQARLDRLREVPKPPPAKPLEEPAPPKVAAKKAPKARSEPRPKKAPVRQAKAPEAPAPPKVAQAPEAAEVPKAVEVPKTLEASDVPKAPKAVAAKKAPAAAPVAKAAPAPAATVVVATQQHAKEGAKLRHPPQLRVRTPAHLSTADYLNAQRSLGAEMWEARGLGGRIKFAREVDLAAASKGQFETSKGRAAKKKPSRHLAWQRPRWIGRDGSTAALYSGIGVKKGYKLAILPRAAFDHAIWAALKDHLDALGDGFDWKTVKHVYGRYASSELNAIAFDAVDTRAGKKTLPTKVVIDLTLLAAR